MCELKNTVRPWSRSSQDQLADFAAAERIEPDIGSSRKTTSGSFDQRLRDADALDHALRELPELQAPLRADADASSSAAARARALGRADSRTARAKYVSSSSAVR